MVGTAAQSPAYYTKGVDSMNTIENLPDEEWREIVGYDGQYFVSNMRRVKSLKGAKERILKAF